jgi:signal transduction histidine kinase/DNA-binding NarL/FixJ family response regulator
MRTLLVITRQPAFAAAIETALDAARFRVITREDAAGAAALLTRGAIDGVILEVEFQDAFAIRSIEEIRALAPICGLLVYAGAGYQAWEEQAYLLGVAHILEKPVRGKLLVNLLERTVDLRTEEMPLMIPPPAVQLPALQPMHSARALEPLRRFSSLLVHSLDAPHLLRDALQQLREALGINRAAVFLRRPSALNTDGTPSPDDHWLRPSHTIGHEPGLIHEFPLSMAAGIGKYLYKHARILRADNPEARSNREIAKEFATLGSAIALPIHDREMLLGVLVIDERITGGGFPDDELAQLFHWLEELGVALRNCWRHEQLAATHGLIDDILGGLGSGCVVIGANCGVLHANSAALRLLAPGRPGATRLDFAEIPQAVGSLIFLVLQKGEPSTAFKWQPPGHPSMSCRVSIQPFSVGKTTRPNAALLVIDDISESERAAQLEIEANKLRLVRQMAWHLAHEIGNAVTPISTMQQLLELQGDDAEMRREMSGVLATSVKRITRLTQQMNFLSRDWDGSDGESVRFSDLIQNAYAEANNYYRGKKPAGLVFDPATAPWKVSGDTKALRHAFSELLLNALQANPENPVVTVRVSQSEEHGLQQLNVEVQDAGPGFSQDIADKLGEPFQSTRSVGLGLGLTVTRKIIENHHGQIAIPRTDKAPGIVKVTLPLDDNTNN